eukprot:TRINITY_DN24219_c0_g1_i1.p2 TRINITY_DN24219_c0_g1~~TRINITY_DN24219_c0_g1_i1.p2  ORF type:complete len:104 (+),score=22.43 TRINITY_DN24219_c0_g1_i1:28-339(+)
MSANSQRGAPKKGSLMQHGDETKAALVNRMATQALRAKSRLLLKKKKSRSIELTPLFSFNLKRLELLGLGAFVTVHKVADTPQFIYYALKGVIMKDGDQTDEK